MDQHRSKTETDDSDRRHKGLLHALGIGVITGAAAADPFAIGT